jgi:hypothetical protein
MNAAQAIAGWALFSAAFGVLSAVLVVAAADINHGLDRWSASLRRTTDPIAPDWRRTGLIGFLAGFLPLFVPFLIMALVRGLGT